jgi:hypothetical protein
MLAIMTLPAYAGELSKTEPLKNHKIADDWQGLRDIDFYPPTPGLIAQSPGDTIGMTYQDVQSYGSSGRRAAVCADGSRYFCWTALPAWLYPPVPRAVWHYWISGDGSQYATGQVSQGTGAGYPQIDVIYGSRAGVVYHQASDVILALDSLPDDGYFNRYITVMTNSIYPHIAVSRSNIIHIIANSLQTYPGERIVLRYIQSLNGGNDWLGPTVIDTVTVISSVINTSPVSERAVIAYSGSYDSTSQWTNDIIYIASGDGLTWDFINGKINVTNYDIDTDSLSAYTDLDVLIDYNDYLHLIWNAQWVTDELVYYRTYLFHYSEETDSIYEITYNPDSLWYPICGTWDRPICKMTLGCRVGTNELYALWTQFDTSDVSMDLFGNGDIFMSHSADRANWDEPINLTDSRTPYCYPGYCDSDHWSSMADLIDNSLHIIYINDKDAGNILQTEGSATLNPVMYYKYQLAEPGYGMITGIVSGGGPNPVEGAEVRAILNNQIISTDITDANGRYSLYYLSEGNFDVELLAPGYFPDTTVESVEVFQYQVTFLDFDIVTSIENDSPIPAIYNLHQNYPNPFNAKTKIKYSLPDCSFVTIEIYDILGRKITTLLEKFQSAGDHEIIWDAGGYNSGLYFCRLKAGEYDRARKMVLMK